MKKLFAFIAAAAMLAFGLSSCKDLHDADIPNMTGWWLHSNVYGDNWPKDSDGKYPSFVATGEENVYACDFTPVGSSLEFGFSQGANFEWICSGEFEISELDKEFSGSIPSTGANSHVTAALTPYATYRMTVTTTADGSATAKVSLVGAPPADMFVISGLSPTLMELADGTYKLDKELSAGTYEFTLFDGTTSYGAKTTSVAFDTETELTSSEDAKPIAVTLDAAGKIRISATIDNDVVKLTVKQLTSFAQTNDITKFDGALYKGDITWTPDGDDLVATIEVSGEIDNAWWIGGTEGASISDVKFGFLLKDTSGNANYRSKAAISVGESVTITGDAGDNDTVTGIKGSFGAVKGDKQDNPSTLILASPVTITLRSTADSITVKFDQQ